MKDGMSDAETMRDIEDAADSLDRTMSNKALGVAAKAFASAILTWCPRCDERHVALRKTLEAAMMADMAAAREEPVRIKQGETERG